jgi:chromosomal replication initiator protein
MNNFWAACLGRFEKELSPQQFNTWIKPLHYKMGEQSLTLFAPNRFVQQWVKDKFLSRVVELSKEELSYPISIDVVLLDGKHDDNIKSIAVLIGDESTPSAPKIKKPAASKETEKSTKEQVPAKKHKISDHSGLNPAYNFSNLVTGKANQLARAAALSDRRKSRGHLQSFVHLWRGGSWKNAFTSSHR